MEQLQGMKNEEHARAKEIDTGAFPLPMANVVLGLPYKPDPTSAGGPSTDARPWTYGDLVSQMKLMATLTVDPNTKGLLWSFQNSWKNVVDFHFGRQFRLLYGLKSWDLNFKIEFRSNFQQVGQFVLSYSNIPQLMWSYMGLSSASETFRTDYMLHTQFPHRKVAMGEDVDINLTCKWLSPLLSSFGHTMYSYETPKSHKVVEVPNFHGYDDPQYDMGTVFLTVPWPMQVATGVQDQAMTVRIWSSLSNLKYAAYSPEDQVFEG